MKTEAYMTSTAVANESKRELGQYYTTRNIWLRPQIAGFIKAANRKSALDPFAGEGHLLKVLAPLGVTEVHGFDIADTSSVSLNDSFDWIPPTDCIIVTNPPYRAKNSATRNRMACQRYFQDNSFINLYQIGLARCLAAAEFVVAIVPESYIRTGHFRERLRIVTILEANPFADTETPCCVACFDDRAGAGTLVFKNDDLVGSLDQLDIFELAPRRDVEIDFGVADGNVGISTLDGCGLGDKIRFCRPDEIAGKVRPKCRSFALVRVDFQGARLDDVLCASNELLRRYRIATSDSVLAPFMGNDAVGKRRRRLDFETARAILEEAVRSCRKNPSNEVVYSPLATDQSKES